MNEAWVQQQLGELMHISQKKMECLQTIETFTENQKTVIEQGQMYSDIWQQLVGGKQQIIDEIEELDEQFDGYYEQLQPYLNPIDPYKNSLVELQDMIEMILNTTRHIQEAEGQNYSLMRLSKEQKPVHIKNKKYANAQYKKTSKTNQKS